MDPGNRRGHEGKMSNARHLANSAAWATTEAIVDAGREVMGGIDLDPCTSMRTNDLYIHAKTIYTAQTNGLIQTWRGRAHVNPPGGCEIEKRKCSSKKCFTADQLRERKENGEPIRHVHVTRVGCDRIGIDRLPPCGCKLVSKFWTKLCDSFMDEKVTQAIWIGFSLEQLQTLQNAETLYDPRQFKVCIPSRRLAYLDPENDYRPAKSPPHSSYVAYLGMREEEFQDRFSEFGSVY